MSQRIPTRLLNSKMVREAGPRVGPWGCPVPPSCCHRTADSGQQAESLASTCSLSTTHALHQAGCYTSSHCSHLQCRLISPFACRHQRLPSRLNELLPTLPATIPPSPPSPIPTYTFNHTLDRFPNRHLLAMALLFCCTTAAAHIHSPRITPSLPRPAPVGPTCWTWPCSQTPWRARRRSAGGPHAPGGPGEGASERRKGMVGLGVMEDDTSHLWGCDGDTCTGARVARCARARPHQALA